MCSDTNSIIKYLRQNCLISHLYILKNDVLITKYANMIKSE